MKRYGNRILLEVLLPLLVGLVIYLYTRSGTWLNHWLQPNPLPGKVIPVKKGVDYFIAFVLPDFCWSFSFCSALFLWKEFSGLRSAVFPLYVAVLVIAQETVQVFFPAYFRFDKWDLLAAVMAFLLSFYLNHRHAKEI